MHGERPEDSHPGKKSHLEWFLHAGDWLIRSLLAHSFTEHLSTAVVFKVWFNAASEVPGREPRNTLKEALRVTPVQLQFDLMVARYWAGN